MKRIALLLIALTGCRGGGVAAPDPEVPPPVEWSADMQTIADGNNRFALELYSKLRESEKGNLFFSPYSIHTALGMTATGAKGTTRDQMVQVLHLPADEQKALACGDLGRFYSHAGKAYELNVANALWAQKGFPWKPEFLAVQKERFGAGFQEADFRTNAEGERVRINQWVEEKTRDKIKDLLLTGDVRDNTRMVLTNAIYFKGKWTEKFEKNHTKDAPFHRADKSTIPVPLMSNLSQQEFNYAEGNGFQLLEMLYEGNELSMVIVLPRTADGLPAIEKELTAEKLAGWMKQARSEHVNVSLPRFRLEQRFAPKVELKAMGMTDAFDEEKANFNGMASERLFIGAVIHKAFVDVNEEGTEAAAATAIVMAAPASVQIPVPPKVFRADHPFLFLIRDVKHGTILFLGRVMNPKG